MKIVLVRQVDTCCCFKISKGYTERFQRSLPAENLGCAQKTEFDCRHLEKTFQKVDMRGPEQPGPLPAGDRAPGFAGCMYSLIGRRGAGGETNRGPSQSAATGSVEEGQYRPATGGEGGVTLHVLEEESAAGGCSGHSIPYCFIFLYSRLRWISSCLATSTLFWLFSVNALVIASFSASCLISFRDFPEYLSLDAFFFKM